MSTQFSVGQMNQLADALEAAGYTPGDVTKMRSSMDALRQFKGVLGGLSEIVVHKHIIDCDADPYVPDGWSVESHKKGGQLEWASDKVALWLCQAQEASKVVQGNELRKLVEVEQDVLNANVLDYLLEHPHLIPQEWKGKAVFFWGTIYRRLLRALCVRYLFWSGGEWFWEFIWLDDGFFDHDNPAAVLC